MLGKYVRLDLTAAIESPNPLPTSEKVISRSFLNYERQRGFFSTLAILGADIVGNRLHRTGQGRDV